MKRGFTMKTCLVIGFVLGMSGISNGANAKDSALPLDFDPSSVCLGFDRNVNDTFTFTVVCGGGRTFSVQKTDPHDDDLWNPAHHVRDAIDEAVKSLVDSGFVWNHQGGMKVNFFFELFAKPSSHDYCVVGYRNVFCTDDNLSAGILARRDGTCPNDEQVLGDAGLKLVFDLAVVNPELAAQKGHWRLFVK